LTHVCRSTYDSAAEQPVLANRRGKETYHLERMTVLPMSPLSRQRRARWAKLIVAGIAGRLVGSLEVLSPTVPSVASKEGTSVEKVVTGGGIHCATSDLAESRQNGDEAQVDLAQGALRKGQFILTSPPSGLLL
jgi:hypothetical protein